MDSMCSTEQHHVIYTEASNANLSICSESLGHSLHMDGMGESSRKLLVCHVYGGFKEEGRFAARLWRGEVKRSRVHQPSVQLNRIKNST